MVLEIVSEQDIMKITILVGAVIGNFFATFIPFALQKSKFKDGYDLHIIFNSQFLGTAAAAAISSFIIVNAAFASIVQQVGAQSTIAAAFISAATLGAAINFGANKFMPTQNKEVKAQAAEIDRQKIIQDYEKEKKLASLEVKA